LETWDSILFFHADQRVRFQTVNWKLKTVSQGVTLKPKIPRSTSLLLTTVVILCTALITNAQEAPKPTQAVLAGKLIDVRTGNIRQHAYILIAGDRIQSIADSAPSGLPVTDLSSYTVVPGLIDAHAHTLSDPTSQSIAVGLRTSIPQHTL